MEEVARTVEPDDVLCGLSLGALVALHIVRRVEVGRLVVCAGFDRLPASLRRRTRALALAARLMPRGFLHRQLVAELPEEHRARALEEITPLRSAELARLMWQAAGSVVDPGTITVPVTVACGERDGANLRLSRALAERLPDACFEPIPAAGHVANLDNPDAFSALLSSR